MYRRQVLSIGILAAASILLESTLTRLLAVTQFYHFAFLVVSLALLGYGASGTLLAVVPQLRQMPLDRLLVRACIGYSISVGFAYGIINFLPFDSYAIAWDSSQLVYFGLYYLVLAIPFMMSGLAAGAGINASKGQRHLVYAANLLGSGIGALLALPSLWLSGVPGTFLLSGILGVIAVIPLGVNKLHRTMLRRSSRLTIIIISFLCIVVWAVLTIYNLDGRSPLVLSLSDYKGLTQAIRVPDAEIVFSRWNAISRVDVVQDAGIHHLPGLSYIYSGEIPSQMGLSLDADSLQPITLVRPGGFEAGYYLPENIVFGLSPEGDTLGLEPGGGLGVLQALVGNASQVTAVISNPMEAVAIQKAAGEFNPYKESRVKMVFESSRVFLQRETGQYDIVMIPLTDAFRPVASGAYSLAEETLLTIGGMSAALDRLTPEGILVVTRWIQTPPSESLRLAATLAEALTETISGDPGSALVLFRGVQTMTILVKPSGWNLEELAQVRMFSQERKYDLVWMPGIRDRDLNQFNRLPEPWYYQSIQALLDYPNRNTWYASYPFDIRPPTDNHPFFYHFFKWEQTPTVLASMGHVWQPFGGSGYLVTLALLGLSLILSLFLILLPLVRLGKSGPPGGQPISLLLVFLYFTLLGFGFLFIEIPLIQESILLLGHPITAFTVIVFTILSFSSLGSVMARSERIRRRTFFSGLVVAAATLTVVYPQLINQSLGWPLVGRVGLVILSLAPAGFLMGFPFPLGLAALEGTNSGLIPWVWGVNGSVSVVASVLAAILALSFGFSWVLWLGTGMYFGAALIYLFYFHTFQQTV